MVAANQKGDMKVVVDVDIDGVKEDVLEASRIEISRAMRITRVRARKNLTRISRASKWKFPGGWAWWRRKIKHFFLRDSIGIKDYETKHGEPGTALLQSDLYYPVEKGTHRSEAKEYLKPAIESSTDQITSAVRSRV